MITAMMLMRSPLIKQRPVLRHVLPFNDCQLFHLSTIAVVLHNAYTVQIWLFWTCTKSFFQSEDNVNNNWLSSHLESQQSWLNMSPSNSRWLVMRRRLKRALHTDLRQLINKLLCLVIRVEITGANSLSLLAGCLTLVSSCLQIPG